MISKKYMFGVIGSLILFWSLCFSYNDSYHFSIERNYITGNITTNGPGYSISLPWVQVVRIDTRPFRSCVDCSCNNIKCKLISFNQSGYRDFIQKEGLEYYWWRNRFSFNWGNEHEYRGLKNVLRGYSFDNVQYSFIKYELYDSGI